MLIVLYGHTAYSPTHYNNNIFFKGNQEVIGLFFVNFYKKANFKVIKTALQWDIMIFHNTINIAWLMLAKPYASPFFISFYFSPYSFSRGLIIFYSLSVSF